MKSGEGKTFGELVGQFRTEAKLTQKKLADLMGRSRGTILNWENGTYLPKERALVLELAKHLHLDAIKKDQLLEAALFDPSGTIWMIPFQRNPFFTGREDVLSHLRQALGSGGTVALMQPQALKGLGGIGKTHTAIEYAYRYRDEYQAILWAPATTSTMLQTSLISIAVTLNLPQKNERDQEMVVKAVKQWLMNHSDWLLILDNVEDLEGVGLLYPWAHSGHVIITTRSQPVGGIAFSISLEKMAPEEGAIFLLHRAGLIGSHKEKEQVQGADYEKAKHLSEVLGGLPLALDQAAAYIEKTRCGLSTYLTLYETQRTKLLNERGSLTTDHPESVTITFALAFQKVKNANIASSELLQFCAFLSPDAIPEEIITNGGASLGSTLETITADLIEFNSVVGVLLAYSLIQRNTDIETGTQILSVHRLVQAVLQDEMKQAEKQHWIESVVLAVNQIFPLAPVELAAWLQCERLLPQVLVAAVFTKQYKLTILEAGQLFHKAASYLFDRARYQEAEQLSQQALQIREQMLGPEHSEVASTLNNLAEYHRVQGKYAEAEPLYRRAIAIKELLSGPEHPEVAAPLNNLAELYRAQGKYTDAEPLYRRALEIWEQHSDPRVANPLHNLAILAVQQQRYVEAEAFYRRALTILEQQLGPMHPKVAHPLNGLAELYKDQGRYAEAEPLYQQALSISEQQLGPEHPEVGAEIHNLAELYQLQEKYAEAEPLYQRALHIFEHLGLEHYLVAYPLTGLADLYREQGKYKEAESLYQHALSLREHALEPYHPDTAATLQGFAMLQTLQGNFPEAAFLYQRALTIHERVYGPQHSKTTESRNHLHAISVVLGKGEEAEQLDIVQSEAIVSESEQEAGLE